MTVCHSTEPGRIDGAAGFKDHKIQVTSFLISLNVEPSPALSINLFGSPLIKIVLTHFLVRLPMWDNRDVAGGSDI